MLEGAGKQMVKITLAFFSFAGHAFLRSIEVHKVGPLGKNAYDAAVEG